MYLIFVRTRNHNLMFDIRCRHNSVFSLLQKQYVELPCVSGACSGLIEMPLVGKRCHIQVTVTGALKPSTELQSVSRKFSVFLSCATSRACTAKSVNSFIHYTLYNIYFIFYI